MELPLPRCFCKLVGLPGAGALGLEVDIVFFFFFFYVMLHSPFSIFGGICSLGPFVTARAVVKPTHFGFGWCGSGVFLIPGTNANLWDP